MVLMNLFSGKEWRHRYRECTLCTQWGRERLGRIDEVLIVFYIISISYPSIYESLLEKAMAPHCSTLAWKIPWTEEPGGLQSMGSLRVRHD